VGLQNGGWACWHPLNSRIEFMNPEKGSIITATYWSSILDLTHIDPNRVVYKVRLATDAFVILPNHVHRR
jgi:hypothetical protein